MTAKRKQLDKNRIKTVALTIGMILAIQLFFCIVNGFYPFGDKTVFSWDLSWQYSAYFAYLRKMLLGDVSSAYSFSMALGSGLAGLIGYYLMSPFNLILCLFPADMLAEAILVITLAKMLTSGVTMVLYLTRKESNWYTSIFAVCYAVSSYTMVQMTNIMWMDALIALPLIVWGIEKLVEEKRIELFVFSLAYGIISNFYCGFMLCLFAGLYFVYYIFWGQEKFTFRAGLRFVRGGITAAALSGFILLPVLISLQSSKWSAPAAETASWGQVNADLLWLPSKMFTGSFSQSEFQGNGLPPVFVGSLVLLLFVLYFTTKEITPKRKYGMLFLTGALFFSMFFEKINLVWHGFSAPQGLSWRYSFLLVFVLVAAAYEAFEKGCIKAEFQKREKVITLFLLVAYATFGLIALKKFEFLNLPKVVFSVICMAVVLICVWRARARIWLLTGICMLEMGVNAGWIVRSMTYYPRGAFVSYLQQMDMVMGQLAEKDGVMDHFRMENNLRGGSFCNDALLLDYNSLTHYSSGMNYQTISFLEKNGMKDWLLSSTFPFTTPLPVASLLGVKYLVTGEELSQDYGYEKWMESGDIRVYRNVGAIPMVSMVNADILTEEYPYVQDWEGQNRLWRKLTGVEHGDIYDVNGTLQMENYQVYLQRLQEKNNRCEWDMLEDDLIYCEVQAEENEILLATFPVEKGWTVRLDGQEISAEKVFDIFYGIPLTQGQHSIIFSYEMPGLKAGRILSLSAICLLAIENILREKRNRRNSV